MADRRTPCIIGAAEETWRDGGPDPLSMWEHVARAAADDAGGRANALLGGLDSVQVVYCQSWQYDDPPLRLAERLRAAPRHRLYSGVGGTTPQLLVGKAAAAIAAGDADLVLVVGGEALATRRRLRKEGSKPAWPHRHPSPPPFPFEDPFHPAEVAHEVVQAWLTFALFDVARRGHLATSLAEHRRRIGALMAPLTVQAAANPSAWFPVQRSAEELITPAPDNRLVAYPYTKYVVSIMDVDMAAALLLASVEKADALGVPADRRVYLLGSGYATDPPYVAAHESLWRSPAMTIASRQALGQAGVAVDDIAHFDLYSCFASSLEFARDALGLADDDSRPLTVTGGLPYFGGPGSNYVTHGIAEMAQVLRRDPGSLGMVSGVGMHMQKHVYGIYSTSPRERGEAGDGAGGALPAERPIRDSYAGPATVAAYTVVHDRDGARSWGVAVCDLPDGTRAYARMAASDLLARAEEVELVGAAVEMAAAEGGVNVVED